MSTQYRVRNDEEFELQYLSIQCIDTDSLLKLFRHVNNRVRIITEFPNIAIVSLLNEISHLVVQFIYPGIGKRCLLDCILEIANQQDNRTVSIIIPISVKCK